MSNNKIDFSRHTVDRTCHSTKACCCGCLDGYPRNCTCGGLIHAESVDSETFGLLVVYRCDTCNFVYDVQEEEY